MGKETTKYCRKCLTRDMDLDGYFDNLHQYIQNLGEDIKSAPDLYENRLNRCKECDRLNEGICNACGCFVELRAVIAKKSCPFGKW